MDQFLQFVQNHWELWLAFAAIVGILIFEETKKSAGGSKRVTTQEVIALMNHEDAKIIDFRTVEEFNNGYILGAINITETNFDAILKKLEQYKNKPLILIHTSETLAANLGNKLHKQGFKVNILAGGFNAWKNASMPVSKR